MISDLLGDGGIWVLLGSALTIYVFWTMIVVILDDRDPASTIAWILFISAIPVVGLVVYLLVGRNTKVLTKKFKTKQLKISEYLDERLKKLKKQEPAAIKKLNERIEEPYQRLLQLVKNTSNSTLTLDNTVEVLQNGSEKFPRLLNDIKKAKDYIHLEYFIWEEDELTQEFQDVLIEKAEKGVEVKILYDSIGGFRQMSRQYRQRFKQSKVQFHSLLSFTSYWNIISAQYRSHNKIAIIDGKIGYTGGMNMGKEYWDGGHRFDSWRDTHIRLSGEAIAPLHAIFAKSWFEARKEMLPKKYFEYHPSPNGHKVPIQLTYSTPYTQFESIKKAYFELICAAQDHIYIQSPYFIPDKAMTTALQTAAMSGVDVRLMITGVPDKKTALGAAHSYFRSVIDAGVKVYLFEAGFLHSKTITIDGQVSTVGTANFDIRSFKLDYEVIALMYDPKTAQELDKDFLNDVKRCRQYTKEDIENTPFVKRLFYSLCRLASPLM